MGRFSSKKNKTTNIQKLAGRDGDSIFIPDYQGYFIDSCDSSDLAHRNQPNCGHKNNKCNIEPDFNGLKVKYGLKEEVRKRLRHHHHHHHLHHEHNSHPEPHQQDHHHHHKTSPRNMAKTNDEPTKTAQELEYYGHTTTKVGCGPKLQCRRKEAAVELYLCSAIWKENTVITKLGMPIYRTLQDHTSGRTREISHPPIHSFENEMLRTHNMFRERHNAAPLTESIKLTELAQAYADYLAQRERQTRSDSLVTRYHLYNGQPCGENLATSNAIEGQADMSGSAVSTIWYKTKKNYKTTGGGNTVDLEEGKAANFTQMIWKGSRKLGVGRSVVNSRTIAHCIKNRTTKRNEQIFVVALYYP